jgi:Family of unknown function (DUF6463)
MPLIAAWSLFLLGVVHIIFGVARFRGPLAEAFAAGFIGKFAEPELRRTAFWFIMVGPLLMLVGQLAVHAASIGDRGVLTVIGGYLLAFSIVGVTAFPKSPLWAPLVLAPFFLVAGVG